MRFPTAADDELQGMVELQLDKVSPFPTETMVVSHEVLERTADSSVVLMAAAREEVINAWGDWLRPTGIRPRRVDASILGFWRLLKDAGELQGAGREVVLVLSDGVPDIIVAQGGIPVVFRSVGECGSLAGTELAVEMAREVGYTLMSLELEHGAGAPDSVSVWCRGKAPDGLVSELQRECGCDVRARDLETLPSIAEGLARRLATDAGGINLTPAAWKLTEKDRLFRKHMLMGAAGVLGGWLVLVGGFFGWLTFERRSLAQLEARRDEWHKPAMEVRGKRQQSFVIKRYLDTKRSALECLREVVASQSPGVDMTAFTYKKDESVKISGEAQDVNQVYDFKTKLDASPLFTKGKSTLQGPKFDATRRKQVFDIDITLPVETAKGAEA